MSKKCHKENQEHRPRFSVRDTMQELLGDKPNIEISDNTSATIEGCKGVVEYSTKVIRVNLGKYIVSFVGRNMNLKYISSSSLIVEGFFLNIEFSV